MVITKLDEYFYEQLPSGIVIKVLVFKTEKGNYSAEVLWCENDEVLASELLNEHKTINKLKKELIDSLSDRDIEIKIEEE